MSSASRWAWATSRRVGDVVVVAALVVIGTSLLVHLAPGDPVRSILGDKASPEAIAAMRAQLSLDLPVGTQIANSLAAVLRGDLGESLFRRVPVDQLLLDALPVTLGIVAATVIISVCVGVPLGLLAALRKGRAADRAIGTVNVVLLAIPTFVLSLLLISVFAVGLGWFPAGGWSRSFPEQLRDLVLPSLALSGYLAPQIMRSTRQSALSILNLQFLESAEARGLSRGQIVLGHLLPNSALPIITVIGINTAALVSSTVVVEALFGLPGLGQLIQEAVSTRDYPVLQGAALAAAIGVVIVNLICELLYRVLDPRVRSFK